jgi:hypothetical protein
MTARHAFVLQADVGIGSATDDGFGSVDAIHLAKVFAGKNDEVGAISTRADRNPDVAYRGTVVVGIIILTRWLRHQSPVLGRRQLLS